MNVSILCLGNKWIGNPKHDAFVSKHHALIEKLKDESIDKQLTNFLKEVSLSEEQTAIRHSVLDDIFNEMKKTFPKCTLQPFGSFLSGISSNEGDIDVFAMVEGIF